MIKTPDGNVDTEEEMDFDDLNIHSDYSDYDILEEEKETISKSDEVWVKTKKEIWRRRVLLNNYSKKIGQQHLKIKWTDLRKEDRVLIKNVSLTTPKK